MSKKSRLWLVAVIFAAFAAAFVWALVLFATKPALADEDIHPELVLKADKQVLYVSGKDSDKTVTVTPELLNSDGEEIDPSSLTYNLDQGQYFGDGLSLTDFYQNDVIDDYEGKITFSINPELTVETFLETYGASQELRLSANYDYYLYPLPLSAQINLTVKAAKDRISLKWAGKEFFADEDVPDFQAETLVLKKGEAIRLEYSVPESSAESAFWGDNGIIRLSNQTETVKNGLKTVTAEAEAIKTGSDMLCVKWNTFTLKLPVRVEESDAVDFPVFSEDFELFKFNGETLITSEKGLSLDRIFKNMYNPNGILTYNGKAGEGRRIEITVEKDGKAQEFKGDGLGSGRYTFRFTLPVKSGVTWADGSCETVEKSAVLGAPIYNVVTSAKSLVYNGSQRLWSEFAAVTKDGRQVSPEDLPLAVLSENMRDAGAYEISFALEEEEAFLTLDGNPTDGEAVLETIISKAELTLKFSGNARYTGARQIIDCAAVKTEYSKEFPQDEYSTAEISFIAGAEVVNAGEYPFTAAADSFGEKAVRVDFNHKNYTLVKAEGMFTVTPAETGAETYTGNEYDGGNHFDDAARINFTGLVGGETFSCGVDYSVTVKSGGVPTENVKDVGLYAVEITLLTDNYVFESGLKNLNSDFLITPKEITAVVSAPSKIYNGLNLAAVPDIGVIFEGLAVGDSLSVADINIEGTAVNAGIYNFSAETGGDNVLRVSLDVGVKNYTLFKACGTFEILPAKLRISLNGKSVYNGKELDLNAAEISLAIKNKDYDYSEIFGVYSLNFKAERAVKDFKSGGYSFGISDNADIAVSLKDGYADNFTIESADGVFVVEKSVITVCGDYFGQMEYGAPLSVKAPLTEYAGLSAEGIYDGDVGITLSYELPDGSVGNYGMERLSLEGELTGKNAFNYTLSIKINSFNVQIVKAKIVGKGQGNSPAVTFFFVDLDGSEKPLYETSEFIFDGTPREVRAYGATAYNDKIAMNLSGGATFCGAGNYEFYAANPDVNLYEYSDGEDFIKITVKKRGVSAEISASCEYNGALVLPAEEHGLNVKFIGDVQYDRLTVSDLIFCGGAISAGSHKIGLGNSEITVKLSERALNNYYLENATGSFEILPAKLRISLNGKSVYNGKELDLNAAEISLAIKNEDYDYSEIFGVYSLNFKAERAVKDFKTDGYSFGISDNADIAVSLKDGYADNFTIESADGVFVVEKSVITVCGDYFGQMEYGAPLSVKAPLTEYAGLSAEGIYDGDVGITLSYELPDGSVGNYGMERLSLEGELTGKNAFNYTLSIKINSFNVQIVKAKIVGKGQGNSPAVTFFFVDLDGSEKPLYETSEFIFDGTPREVRAYGATAYNDKIAMNLSGGATFCGAGNYEFYAANPDVNLYEYSDGEDFIKITVKKRGVSAEISASCEYNGALVLPAEEHGLNVKFIGDVQYDRLTVSDLIFCGGAISAGSHKIGLGDAEITVKLGERALNNYYLESATGSFEILPATIKITGSANKPVRYTGGRVETAFFALSEGLSMQSFAQADGVEVQFKLLTSSACAGSYFYPNDFDGGLTVSYSVSVPEEKAENYSKEGGDFAVDFSEARFSVKIVMAEIVTVKWFLGRDGNFIPFDGGALKFDACSYCVFAEAEYIDENGDLRSLGKDEISVSVRGLTPEDEKKLVYSGDTAAIRNAGEYYASLESDVYAIKDGIKSVAIKIEPYVFEIKGHTPAEEGDLLYGGSTIKGIDGGEVVLGTKAYSEAVRATYSLDVTQTKDGKRANFDFAGFASADTYYNLIPFDIILSSASYYFDSSNYVCVCPNNYALKIAPVTVRAERAKYEEVYAGFMGEEGIFTAEKLVRKAAIVFSESQAGGLSISENLEIPDFGVKFSGGNLSDFNGTQAAVNAGEYSFCLVLENANFCFEDGTDTIAFIIKPAEISVVLEKSESIYCAEDFSDDIRLKFFCGASDVSSCFCDGAGNAIGVSPDGIFGFEGGAPSFGMKFFADPYFSALTNVQLKDAGTYCVKTEFCEYISENFILDTASENLIYTVKPSEVLLEADSLDFTENSDYTEIFSGLRDYLVYDKNVKEIIISTAAVTEGESDGKYFIPMYRVFGGIKGFYGEKDLSALTVTLATSAEAAIYKIAVSVGHSENYKVQCPILSAQIEVAPRAAEVEWRFNGSAAKSGVSITFNGNDRLSEFSAAATGIDGETIALSEPLPVLVRDGKRITDVGLLNAGVYELSVSSENRNYMLSGNVLNVEIAPRPVTGGELLEALVWRNSSNGNSLLQDGCYDVDSEKVDAANSFVGYKKGMDNAIVMGEAPQTCGCPAFTVKYTGNKGGDIGGYCLKATLSLGGNLHGELFFVNFAWESGFYENLRGDGGKDYGETVSYNRSSGCIEVTKKWYVVILNNGLESGLELPAAEGGVNVNYGWTFGNDFRICGYPSPLRDNAVTYVSFGRFSDGIGEYGGDETISEAVWRNNFEIARICVAYSPENRDLSDGKIRNFIDYWLNAATPAGDYAVIVYIAEEESGGEIYAPYFEIWRFSVLTAPLSFTENPVENFEAEYDGTPHFFKDGRMPKFDNLSGEEIDGLRRGTGWAAESVERPAGNSFNIDILYGRSGETYAQLRILITDDISDGYHDISDSSDDWNLLANPALPISVGASGSGGGAYVLFYKIILANYDEYATVGGCRLSAEECRYSVKINARIISLEAWGGGGITVSGDKLSWESGAADEVDFTVTGWIACGGELDFRYKFLPVREDGENTVTENYPEFSAKTENGVLRLVVPGYADSGKFILYIYMYNYEFSASKSAGDWTYENENFVLEGDETWEEGGVEVFKIYVGADAVGEKGEKQKSKPLAAQTKTNVGFWSIIFTVLAALVIAAASALIAAFHVNRHR